MTTKHTYKAHSIKPVEFVPITSDDRGFMGSAIQSWHNGTITHSELRRIQSTIKIKSL